MSLMNYISEMVNKSVSYVLISLIDVSQIANICLCMHTYI